MGFRFFRRVRIAPGLTLNFSKRGMSLSAGPRGMKYTVGSRGRRATMGIPGTGLFFTQKLDSKKRKKKPSSTAKTSKTPAGKNIVTADRKLSIKENSNIPPEEKNFYQGCQYLMEGQFDRAYELFKITHDNPDAAFLAGLLALKKEGYIDARWYLESVLPQPEKLGHYFKRLRVQPTVQLPVTDTFCAIVKPDMRGLLLALVEVYQRLKQYNKAVECLKRLRRYEPNDPVVKLSLAELLYELNPANKKTLHYIINLTEGIDNESPIHTALLFYRGKALAGLGLYTAACEVLTSALRRKKDRSQELLMAIRYARALVYQQLGSEKRYRQELEKLYAQDGGYEDVGERLLGERTH